jgi:hypothetical protein
MKPFLGGGRPRGTFLAPLALAGWLAGGPAPPARGSAEEPDPPWALLPPNWEWVGAAMTGPAPNDPRRALIPADPRLWAGREAGVYRPSLGERLWSAGPTGAAPRFDDWTGLGFRPDGGQRALGRQTEADWGKLNAKVVLADPADAGPSPAPNRTWKTENSVRVPLAGSLFVVGQVDSRSDSVEAQLYKLETRTGVGAQVPFLPGGEVQVRGGRSVTNTASDSPSVVPGPDKSQYFLELLARSQFIGATKLEYTASALSPTSPTGRDQIKQDFRLAVPLGDNSQFHVGAKYKSEDTATTPWTERMQLYLGVQWKR